MIIEKDCDNSKRLQKKIHVSNKMNLSSNVNDSIRAVLFFYKKISHTQKAQKAQKA